MSTHAEAAGALSMIFEKYPISLVPWDTMVKISAVAGMRSPIAGQPRGAEPMSEKEGCPKELLWSRERTWELSTWPHWHCAS